MTSNFRVCYALVNMIFLTLFLLFCPGTPALAGGRENSIIDLPSTRDEELVNWAGYGEEKLSRVVITGELLCHGDRNLKDSVHPPTPVSGASIAILCGGPTAIKPQATATTDGYGEFLIDLPSHLHAIPNLEKICCVKVFDLPKSSSCRHAFSEKHKGIHLTSINEGIRTYTTQKIRLVSKRVKKHVKTRA